jgi:hypothetical protein
MKTYSISKIARACGLSRSTLLYYDRLGLWVEMLRTAGMDQNAMNRWHAEFESRAPDGHNEFLLSLGIADDEVARIRRLSRGYEEGKPGAGKVGVGHACS